MVTVRTDIKAIIYAIVVSAAFAWACGRHGYYTMQTDTLTSDQRIIHSLTAGIAYAAFFVALHLLFRKIGLFARGFYAAAGAVALVGTFLLTANAEMREEMLTSGYFLLSLLIPAGMGAIFGFLYHLRAGYDTEGDRSEALAAALNPDTRYARSPISEDQSHVTVGGMEYFDGPLRVRTSFGTMVIAAIAGSTISNFGLWFFFLANELQPGPGLKEVDPFFDFGLPQIPGLDLNLGPLSPYVESFAAILGGAFVSSFLMAIPFAAVIYVVHLIVRARGKTDYLSYALAGLVVPPVLGLLLFFVFFFIGLSMAFPCAIAMVIYRNLAGLEPVPVKEDIHVEDRRSLVGADHARRRFGRVINTPRL